ncbi:hypothetical protein ACOME3_005367 [Neoechinorhynchus agilis]
MIHYYMPSGNSNIADICVRSKTELKSRLVDLSSVSNDTIERFYLTSGGSLSETEYKIRADVEWRKVVRPDLTKMPDPDDPFSPQYAKDREAEVLNGIRDNQGNGVLLIRCAKHNGNVHDDKYIEYVGAAVEETLKKSPRLTILFDLYNLRWRNVNFFTLRRGANMINDHYPELITNCLMLRPPSFFTYVFGVARHFLGNRIIQRIYMIETKAELKKYVEDTSKLPKDVSFSDAKDVD